MPNNRDLIEIFGHLPSDLSSAARSLWNLGACPFTHKGCIQYNHDQSIIYGTCSVTSPYGDVIICPNRLYANDYQTIRRVSTDAFGEAMPFLLFDEYLVTTEMRGMDTNIWQIRRRHRPFHDQNTD